MGDLDRDTRLTGGDGHWTAELSADWEIWGPCGGYVAALLLRAAGAASRFPVPLTLAVQFLGVARFEPVDLHVETLQAGRRSECLRVLMTQGDRPVSHAVVWTKAAPDGDAGITYDWTRPPQRPGPEDVPSMDDLWGGRSRFPFWDNLDDRPLTWLPPEQWAVERPLAPELASWYRFRPRAAFADPYVEAARVAVICDLMGWPSVVRALDPGVEEAWMAPNIDVNVTFHHPPAGAEWLLLEAESPVAAGGTIGASGRVWAEDGRLLATSTQQMLTRPVPAPG